jgi:ParB family transcriptional regulator, chromosome partitioning protein
MALGKKLDSIIGDYFGQESISVDSNHQRIEEIEIASIGLNPYQTRRRFDSDSIKYLAQDIAKNGLIQPIVVMEVNGNYQLIAGERRLRAYQELKLPTIPCIIKYNVTIQQQAILMAMENLQREDLSAIEKAETYQMLLRTSKISTAELAKDLGYSEQYLKNHLRLLELEEVVKDALLHKKMTEGQARHLVHESKSVQEQLTKRIITEQLTVKEISALLKESNQKPQAKSTETSYSKHHKINKMLFLKAQRLCQEIEGATMKCLGDDNKGKITIKWG